MQCPRCNVEMDEVRKIDVLIDSCSRCGGIWLDAGELDKLRSAWQEALAEPADERRGYGGSQANRREERHDHRDEGRHARHDDRHGHADGHGRKKRSRREGLMSLFEGLGLGED